MFWLPRAPYPADSPFRLYALSFSDARIPASPSCQNRNFVQSCILAVWRRRLEIRERGGWPCLSLLRSLQGHCKGSLRVSEESEKARHEIGCTHGRAHMLYGLQVNSVIRTEPGSPVTKGVSSSSTSSGSLGRSSSSSASSSSLCFRFREVSMTAELSPCRKNVLALFKNRRRRIWLSFTFRSSSFSPRPRSLKVDNQASKRYATLSTCWWN